MAKIFKLLEKNPNEPLSVEEFIESYVYYEEQLKIKIIKIEKFLDDLTEEKSKFEEEKADAQNNEYQKENGLSNKSNIFITLIEGKDFDGGGILGQNNYYTQLDFQGMTQKSLVKSNTDNPGWNENFKFPINSLEGVLKIEVFNKTYIGNKSVGSISFNLEDLKNQEEKTGWFDLNAGKGKLRMKVLCIINLVNYYESEINKVMTKLKNFENIYDELGVYEIQMKSPFGIIFTENLDPLLNTDNLRNSENFIDTERELKKNIYAAGGSEGVKLKSVGGSKIKWNKITQILMILLIFSTFFTLLERSDFFNLFIAIIISVLFILDKNSNIEKYLQPLILTIGGSLIYDFIWFCTHFSSFVANCTDPEKSLKRWIYLFCIGNFILKACLINGLSELKKKKLYSSFANSQ